MTHVAAIDCGTNSIRLLIAEPDGSGGLRDLDRRLEIVRLGQGVDATGEFHPDALQRTFAAVDHYAELIKKANVPVEKVHFVATSATRDAKNRDSFFAGIKQRLGVLPDVISGETEARLSFMGALSRVTPEGELVLVMDIGGGSTELITGSGAGEMRSAISLDIGSVRVTERFLKQNPVADDDLARAMAYVDDLLAGSGVDFASIGTWIGVAGTATPRAGRCDHRGCAGRGPHCRALAGRGPHRQRVRHSRWDCPAAAAPVTQCRDDLSRHHGRRP